jgi:hypothetical protein
MRPLALVLALISGIWALDGAAGGHSKMKKGPTLSSMAGMPNMPYIDVDQIPTGSEGYSDLRVDIADQSIPTNIPDPDVIGDFRVGCAFSHMNFDDPIVFPGEPGRSHLHVYFGNTDTDAYSTADSLAKTGNSTCHGGIMNRSAYWQPALVDIRTGAPIAPDDSLIYYKTGYGGIDPVDVQPIPVGLRMIAGDHTASGPQDEDVYWDCFEESVGHLPTPPVEDCAAVGGEHVVASVTFPQCWDGVNLDSPDHKSHMADTVDGACPDDHPVPIPSISILVFYRITDDINAAAYWRLSSDMYDWSLPGGASIHGDYFSGWDDEFMQTFTEYCENASVDCHAHLLGDGRLFY